jgi:hypothetical protein
MVRCVGPIDNFPNNKQKNTISNYIINMNIDEIKKALNEGNVDAIYDIIDSQSPTDEEREQLGQIALEGLKTQPEAAVAVALGATEEYGRKVYLELLLTGSIPALEAMVDGEIPGSDAPIEEDFLQIAEKAPTESWDWAISKTLDFLSGQLPSEIACLVGDAAALAAEKNPALFEKLKTADFKWEKSDGNEMSGGVCILAAIHSKAEGFAKVLDAYDAVLADCAVAAAENGRHDNLEVLEKKGYDLTGYPMDHSNGTLADIAALYNHEETQQWLQSRGVKRDF